MLSVGETIFQITRSMDVIWENVMERNVDLTITAERYTCDTYTDTITLACEQRDPQEKAGYLGDGELWKMETRRNGVLVLVSEECDTLEGHPRCGTVSKPRDRANNFVACDRCNKEREAMRVLRG